MPAPDPDVPTRTSASKRTRALTSEEAEALREMAKAAATVGGGMPADHPARRVSEEFDALLAGLVAEIPIADIAAAAGIKPRTVQSRLIRRRGPTREEGKEGLARDVVSAYRDGVPVRTIKDRLGVSNRFLYGALRQAGILPVRKPGRP